MALERIHFQTYNRSVRDVLRPAAHDQGAVLGGDLIFDPPYQRASIWTNEQRVNLIKSTLQGLPVGVIFLNDRGFQGRHDGTGRDIPSFAVVDGKQRLQTYKMWFEDCVVVPADWFDSAWMRPRMPTGATTGAWFSDLDEIGQRFFVNNAMIATYETKLKTIEEEAELYERINYGGTPHESLLSVRPRGF